MLRIAWRHKILDLPNERSSHNKPVPRGGGLAIVITWYLGISVLFVSGQMEAKLYFALLSGLILAVISFVDDIYSLSYHIRIIVQIVTAITAFFFMGGIEPVTISYIELNYNFILYPLTIIGIVWFINLFNFLDGIDGYASMEAIMLAIFIYFFTGSTIFLVLIACTAGFLIWNWPKAKIFMGDIGSTQLGFILVILGIYFHNEMKLSILYWILLSSLFWYDATYTLVRRWWKKEELNQAHRKHIYQRAVLSGLSHIQVDLFAIVFNTIIASLVFLSLRNSTFLFPAVIIISVLLIFLTVLVERRYPFR
jgi:Fuc2NAc and GlcNAc transferase